MGKTIFMIHGMWGGPWYWENYKSAFEKEGYSCLATTLPYHDMKPRELPDSRLGKDGLLDYAEALENEIRQLPDKPVIMGHSMGGLLALILASRGSAKAAILLTPAWPAGIKLMLPYSVIKSFLAIQMHWGFWRKPMRQSFKAAVYSMLHLVPAKEQREIYDRFVYESGRAAAEIGFWWWWLFSKAPSRVEKSNVTCPLLIIAGTQDRITPVSVVRRVADEYKHVAVYKEFPNHAHWVVGEPGWQEIANYVVNWVQKLPAK